MLHDLFFYKMSVNFMDSISCRIRWNFSKFNHFREDFHIMLSELREIPGNCQRSVHFPEIFRGSEIFEIFSKSGRQKLGLASRDLWSFLSLLAPLRVLAKAWFTRFRQRVSASCSMSRPARSCQATKSATLIRRCCSAGLYNFCKRVCVISWIICVL